MKTQAVSISTPLARRGCAAATAALLVALLTGGIHTAQAGTADISNVPLGTSSVNVKPNILFILDDSGSMAWSWMPDELGRWDWWSGYVAQSGKYGYWSAQCNGVAYDPAVTYTAPVKADGTDYSNASITAAWTDGFNTGAGTTDLSANYYYTYSGTQTKLNWTYSTDGSVDTSTTFYQECMSDIGASPGSSKFTLVNISSLTTAQKGNYANWYSYYRTRQLMMRTGVGRAFQELDANYRVGFTVISDKTVTSGNFVDVRDFDNSQKTTFFSKLYGSSASGSTPLRAALSKAGRYYGKVVSDQSYDPMQYSCQRSYAMLSTDGYWNTGLEASDYGPYKLDNSTSVGQQDGDEVRPMQDGAATVVTSTTTTTNTSRTTTTGTANLSTTYERTYVNVNGGSCSRGRGRTATLQTQRRTDTATGPYTQVQDVTTTTTRIVVVTNGVTTSDRTNTSSPTTTNSATAGTPTSSSTGTWTDYGSSYTQCIRGATAGDTYYDPNSSGSQVDTGYTWQGTPTTSTSNIVDGPHTTTDTSATGGSSDSLADVAEYYYKTDLRSDLANNIKGVGQDTATHQHLTTYTLGLGLRGTLAYDPNYLTQTSGDYVDVKNGTKQWPTPSGTLGNGENATHIDDLWHTAVNGRGRYFSASNTTTLVNALSTTLGEIKAIKGASSAAATSTVRPVSGDKWIFLPSYVTGTNTSSWYGDVRAFEFTVSSNSIGLPSDMSDGTEVWSAKAKLESRATARTIYMNSGGSLVAFSYSNLSSTQKAYFDNRCTSASVLLSQCGDLTTTAKAKVTGANIVSYLAGDKSLYLSNASADDQVFRTRTYLMGDIVNASPVFVGKPPFTYGDAGYATFKSAQAGRTKVLYVAANDGMLHAIKVGTDAADSSGGTELWAFVPSAAMPEMWRLASAEFDSVRRPYVDATPVVGDIYDSANNRWRTILVGGLGGGGRGYYALDITDPASPAVLWEFTDTNLGLTYGNPIIGKNKSGTWVVMFASGLNNVSSGDGVGRLYVRNALTGAAIDTLSTGSGSSGTPSNLSSIEGWVNQATDNTITRVYGGDMDGNLWRFDYDDVINPGGKEVLLLGQARTSGGATQPITTRPMLNELSISGSKVAVVSFGTGRYLGSSDLSDSTTQSIYTIKDALGTTGLGNLHANAAKLVGQTLGTDRKVTSPSSIDWTDKNGWYIDLTITSKERVHVDGVALNPRQLAFATSVPGSDPCTPGGVSYLYQFDLLNGTVTTLTSFSTLVVGTGVVVSASGQVYATTTGLSGEVKLNDAPPPGGVGSSGARRASWRELID